MDNIIKGPITSLLGLLVMVASFVAWFIGYLPDTRALVAGGIGFALLFMRDKLPGFVERYFNNKMGGPKS